ncbi:ABC-F family ATP-binding cassette domain-containing protein [soil metagenome]
MLADELQRPGQRYLHMAPTTILNVFQLQKTFGSEQIFEGLSFQIAERERVALVGVNGAGKSTVLKIVAGLEELTAGVVSRAQGLRLTYLPQEARFTSARSVLEEAALAFEPVLQSAARMRQIEVSLGDPARDDFDALLEEYDQLQHRFEVHGGFEMDHRTEQILTGLGFSEAQYQEPVRHLSGGQRTRVALAKALLGEPDLLLLDEPTNHLDLGMLEWLEDFLVGWGGACLVVSHDRYFLNRVTARTLELAFGGVEDYPAAYSGYLKLRGERFERRWKEYEAQQEFIGRTEEFIRKYKAGQRAREAKGRQTRLDRLERISMPQSYQALKISLSPALRSGETVLKTAALQVGYPATTHDGNRPATMLASTPELTIERGDCIGLIGPNGGGKTTLLRTLIGELPPLKGSVELGVNVTIGYYAQAHEQLPPQGTPLSVILQAQPMGEESARNYLGRFLFSGDDVFKPVSALSGGERSRLALGLLLLQRANVLVLDEPTNHLDVAAREALEVMLKGFDGTILFVSHDRYFVDRIATRIWSIDEGRLTQKLGNYTDFLRSKHYPGLELEPAKVQVRPRAEDPAPGPDAEPRDRGPLAGDGQRKKAIERAERDISRIEGKLNTIAGALTIAEIDQNYDEMAHLSAAHDEAQASLDQAYLQWETLQQAASQAAPEPAGRH